MQDGVIQWEARHLRPHGKSIPKTGPKCRYFASLTGCMYQQISRGKLFTRPPKCAEYLHCSLLNSLVDPEGRAIIFRMKYKVNAGNFPWKAPLLTCEMLRFITRAFFTIVPTE
jgi:hypothetical protein